MRNHRRHSFAACQVSTDRIAAALRLAGAAVTRDSSRLSASQFVLATREREGGALEVKVRVSDHADCGGGGPADVDAFVAAHGSCDWRAAARAACALLSLPPPPCTTAEARAARQAAAAGAAATRRQTAARTELGMLAAISAALAGERATATVTASRVIDRLYPGVPRTRRQRLAAGSASAVTRRRAIAAAIAKQHWFALPKLGARHAEARTALLAGVGPERFAALRPPRHPRALWTP